MAVNGKVKKVEPNYKKGFVNYFRSLKGEFKRITWPQKKDIKKAFLAVVVFCVFYLIITAIADGAFSKLSSFIFGR